MAMNSKFIEMNKKHFKIVYLNFSHKFTRSMNISNRY